MVTTLISAIVALISIIATSLFGERKSKRDKEVADRQAVASERQASASEGGSIASLSVQVIALTERIVNLETDLATVKNENIVLRARVTVLESDNEMLKSQLASAQLRVTAALGYISTLIRWVEGGAKVPAPNPEDIIADEVVLPPSWLHPNTEAPKE